jgi:hypothetical protein
MEILNRLPLATIAFLAILAAGFYCLIDGQITFEEFGVALGVGGAGTAPLGHGRNQAGKGVERR